MPPLNFPQMKPTNNHIFACYWPLPDKHEEKEDGFSELKFHVPPDGGPKDLDTGFISTGGVVCNSFLPLFVIDEIYWPLQWSFWIRKEPHKGIVTRTDFWKP